MNRAKLKILFAIALLLSACAQASSIPADAPGEEAAALKIAVLPIIDTLPMYVASQEELYAKNGVRVEFIPVASAPERDQLLAAGQADGTINETLAVMLFNREKVQLQAVRYALRPSEGRGHFFILASGRSGITSVEGLKGVEIGVSPGTVIEYVAERILQAEGFTEGEVETIAVPKIPDRLALLAIGELQAGVLPDPLASLAVAEGAVIVADDSTYPEYGFSIISFRKEVIDAEPDAIRGFLSAIEEATALLNADPEKYKNVLSDQKLVPPPLLASYQAPVFPAAGVPTLDEWNDALAWAIDKEMLKSDVSYADSVNASYLP